MTVVVEGATAHQISVHYAGLIHEGATADFQVELALWDCGHASPHNTIGPGGDFHPMANTGDG